jgi:segregation and condensation protein B
MNAKKNDELVYQIEAVLFAAGKPLSAREIAAALGADDAHPVQRAVRSLEESYGDKPSALEVRRVGDRYALQLKERYVPTVHSVTPMEMAPRTLKALTLIAYHQPILQSMLVRMLGDVTYEEVAHLRGLGLVKTEPKGSTLELSTTKRFAEYFGIPSGRTEEIRRLLEQKLGVPPSSGTPVAPAPSSPSPQAPPAPSEASDPVPPEAARTAPASASPAAPT